MVDGIPRIAARSLGGPAYATVFDALARYGCCVLTGADAALADWSELLAAARRLHAAGPAARYHAWRGRQATWRGYQPWKRTAEEIASAVAVDPTFLDISDERQYDSFDVGPAWMVGPPEGSAGVIDGPQPWPDLPGFAEEITELFVRANEFGVGLARGLLSHGPEPVAMPRFAAPCSSLRLLRYGAGAGLSELHTDFELLTLIGSDRPGLQVMDRSGTWRRPQVREQDMLLIAGEVLEATTRGAIRASVHRVAPDADVRHSVVVFIGVEFGLELRIPTAARVMPFGQFLEGMLIRGTPQLWSRYRRGELAVPYALPEPNPFKGEAPPAA